MDSFTSFYQLSLKVFDFEIHLSIYKLIKQSIHQYVRNDEGCQLLSAFINIFLGLELWIELTEILTLALQSSSCLNNYRSSLSIIFFKVQVEWRGLESVLETCKTIEKIVTSDPRFLVNSSMNIYFQFVFKFILNIFSSFQNILSVDSIIQCFKNLKNESLLLFPKDYEIRSLSEEITNIIENKFSTSNKKQKIL
jgi:hypothetical protein